MAYGLLSEAIDRVTGGKISDYINMIRAISVSLLIVLESLLVIIEKQIPFPPVVDNRRGEYRVDSRIS